MNKKLTTIFLSSLLSTSVFAADVSIHGQVEESVQTTNGVSDLVGDNYLGVDFNESLNNNDASAFGRIQFAVDSDASANADQVTNREVYVGIDFGSIAVSAGKMPNLRKSIVQSAPGYFKGNSLFVTGQTRADDIVKVEGKVAGVKLAATTILDGTSNADSVGETRELGASIDVKGVSFSAVGTKVGSDETTVMYGAKAKVGGVKLGVAHEPDLTNVATTVVGSINVNNNTFMLGNKFVDGSDNTMIGEVTHNFSKGVYAFANYKKPENTDSTSRIGIGFKF